MNVKCWFFGHKIGQGDLPDESDCRRCGEPLFYADFVEYTKWETIKEWIAYHLLRRWLPAKCSCCGKRRDCCEDCIPF